MIIVCNSYRYWNEKYGHIVIVIDFLNKQKNAVSIFFFAGLFRRTDGKFLSEYVFREQSHALTVLHGLNEQRKSNTLCDVIICVEGEKFACHRNILAACSPYFLAMFTGDELAYKGCDTCIVIYHVIECSQKNWFFSKCMRCMTHNSFIPKIVFLW
jgi:hypothetical protein